MKYRVGKCPVCGQRKPIELTAFRRTVVGAKRESHNEAKIVVCWHQTGTPAMQCDGVGLEVAPDPALDRVRARREQKRRAMRFALIEPFRAHAAVAMDALIEGRAYPDLDVEILKHVAVFEHRQHHGDAWTKHVVRSVSRTSGRYVLPIVDLYCTFCGVLLLGSASRPIASAMQDARLAHATICALEHLAFAKVGADPSVRRLPEEHRQSEGSP